MLDACEWVLFSTTTQCIQDNLFRRLRVTTTAHGTAQVSTWRPQLASQYALPLMASSTLLYWLVSNCMSLLVTEGGYVQVSKYSSTKPEGAIEAGLSEQVIITIGYSPQVMVATIVLGVMFVCVVLGLGIKRLLGEMPVVGSNYIAISTTGYVVAPIGRQE
ncbi:hypothetical protein V8F33_013968 [Rhypophila sp. PSN 637]